MATGPYCTNNAVCDAGTWWCTPERYVATTAAITLFWTVIFYISSLLYPVLEPMYKRFPSKYANEETPYWLANHVTSTVHAILITVMVVPTWFRLIYAQPQAQFSQPTAGCPFLDENAVASNAAHIFMCYIIFDLIIGYIHGLHASGNEVHHVIFISFCVIVMYNCFFALGALTLLLMETSTIFLNIFSFWRNRMDKSHPVVKVSMFLFGLFFFLCRIVALIAVVTYFGNLLWTGRLTFEELTPKWHLWLISAGLVAAFFLQLMWFGLIVKKMCGDSSRSEEGADKECKEEILPKDKAEK